MSACYRICVASGDTYQATLTAPNSGVGSINLQILRDAVEVGNDVYVNSIPYAEILNLPVWQSGSALTSTIEAMQDARINIRALVPNADTIEVIAGLEAWMAFDGTTLILTDAPILEMDTEFKVVFRAMNTDGSRKANFMITVPRSNLVTLHNSLFFKEPLNYEDGRVALRGTPTKIIEMTDNDYETFSRAANVDIDMSDSGGNATPVNYVVIKYKGDLKTYRFTPTGGTGSGFTRTLPSEITTYEGGSVSVDVNGFKHDLFPLPTQVTATSVHIEFIGTDVEIYALMLLELGIEIDANLDYLDMSFDKVDRVGSTLRLRR